MNMYQTSFLLKLEPVTVGRSINNVGGVMSKVKLAKQIKGAKFIEVFCDFSYLNATMAAKCNLIDDSFNFTNVEKIDGVDVLKIVRQSTTILLMKGDKPNRMIPIDPAKSVIDEFFIEIFFLRENKNLSDNDKNESFIQIIIHHTDN